MAALAQDIQALGFELVETHISWVFLADRVVYKVKKPVDFGFLDFTSIEKRREACEAEVRLNARLAPNVYRGVVPVTRSSSGQHALGGSGTVVDWAVEMTRLADSARADVMLAAGTLTPTAIDQLAERIARFHAAMPTNEAIAAFGRPEVIAGNVSENFEQTRATVGQYLSEAEAREIETTQLTFVERHRDLLEARMKAGRVRDGHGDLRLEHVYFVDGEPVVIDCIEFNERFRYEDVCADIAFLSMDLARLGRVDLAERWLGAYAASAQDYELYRLVDFYEGYRAYVRAKVASMLAEDPGASPAVRARAASEARRYYLLALSAGREPLVKPALVAVGGIIGSGKSTVAERIGGMMTAPILGADRTRKALLGVASTEPLHEAAWTGAYAPELTERVYETLFRNAAHVLASGRPVVLDASFRSRRLRERARAVAEAHGVPFFFVETRASAELCRQRLERRAQGPSVSDGRLEIFDAFVARWEPVDELVAPEHIVVDTALPIEDNAQRLRTLLPAWPPGLTQ